MTTDHEILLIEETAYNNLREKIEEIEVNPSLEMQSVLESNDYETLFISGFGCEVISLYVTSQQENINENFEREQIEFLYDSKPGSGALNFPMFTVSEPRSDQGLLSHTLVQEETIKKRRVAQKEILDSQYERTSAELCARYLHKKDNDSLPSFLLLPFGEILAYCYLNHILDEISNEQNTSERNWTSIGLNSWDMLIRKFQETPNIDKNNVMSDLLKALKEWYLSLNNEEIYDRSMVLNRILAVYVLPDETKLLLQGLNPQEIENEGLNAFLNVWAKNLYESLISDANDEDIKRTFRNKTLINPIIEEILCTRGLYVMIIRSPLNGDNLPSPPLSQAYAICTIYDTRSLENKKRRTNLNKILLRLSHNDLARYDYQKLEMSKNNISEKQKTLEQNIFNHDQIKKFLSTVSSSSDSWEDLLQAACRTSLHVSKAYHVIVSMREIGTFILYNDSSNKGETHEVYQPAWFGHLSDVTNHCNNRVLRNYIDDIHLSETPVDKQHDSIVKLKKLISRKLEIILDDKLNIELISVGDKGSYEGIIILFIESSKIVSNETMNSMNQIAIALSIGIKMPFRSMIGKGLISKTLGLASCIWYGIINFIVRIPRLFSFQERQISPAMLREQQVKRKVKTTNKFGPASPKQSVQVGIDGSLATMLEFTQIGFVSIGITFLISVFMILYSVIMSFYSVIMNLFNHPISNNTVIETFKKTIIIETLGNVEKIVMAFSICLAATGIMFLIKPQLAFGQPKWMKKFAKPGTLEQTLIKLAALVLTIDLLSVILQLQDSLKSSNTYLWVLVKPAMFHLIAYIIVLIGLAFLFEFLFKEKDSNEEEPES